MKRITHFCEVGSHDRTDGRAPGKKEVDNKHLTEHVVKTDFFEGAHMLPEEVEKVEGAANFRQVSGFPVFGLAQPSPEGMKAVLDKVTAAGDDKSNKEPRHYCQMDIYCPRVSF